MNLFLSVFFLLYAGMHAYAFLRARAALGFGFRTAIPLALFMTVMFVTPFIIRLLEKGGHDAEARLFAWAGYCWLGVLFLFCSSAGALDVLRLASTGTGMIMGRPLVTLSSRMLFFLPLVSSIWISVYGYFEAQSIRTERVEVRSSKIPKAAGRIRIVQVSDLHLGLINRERLLLRTRDLILRESPDIVVATGDIVDGQICRLNGLSRIFRQIAPRFGKFAVTGNHEFFAGIDNATCFIEESGFVLLRGDKLTATEYLTIAGVDDPVALRFGQARGQSERALLAAARPGSFVLLLKHRPSVDPESARLIDLQLSGHVHKGQVFPFSILTWLYYPVQAGFVRVADHCHLYVSRGTGTWGPPIRFLSPPEVTVIDLLPEA